MSAEFTVTAASGDNKVKIGDDLSIETDSPALTELMEFALALRPLPGYEPHQVTGVAEYLVEKFGGKDLSIERPTYFDDPPGVVY